MAFSDNLHDLEHLISDAMGNALEGARRVLAEQLHRRSEAGLRDARERGFRDLREATARLDGARTQADVLSALLEEGGRFASRTALLLTFADGARGWASYGFSDQAQGMENLRLSYDEPALAKLSSGRGAVTLTEEDGASLASHFGGPAPANAVLVPLVLRDRVAAALYADQLRASDAFVPAALQLLVYSAAHLLEGQGIRDRASTPTLAGIDSAEVGAGLSLWDPAAFETTAAPAESVAPAAPAPPAPAAPAPSSYKPAPAAPAPAWQAPAPAEPPVAEAAPAPWEEVPEEPAWSAPPEAPEPVGEPVPTPSWQPSWQMDEAPSAPAPAPATPAAEEAWVYTDQGYEADDTEQTYEGAAVEEVAAEAVPEETADYAVGMPEVEAFDLSPPPLDEPALLEASEAELEETVVEAVEEEPSEDTSPWQSRPTPVMPERPESTTSPLYSGPLYPSEATVRISRDLLQGATAAAPVQADISEDSTVHLPRSSMQAPAPLAPPPPAPAAPPLDETQGRQASSRPAPVFGVAGGTTEVQPPPDLEGPGWAFRGDASTASYRQQTDENAGLHEEARRLARLLVSEIKLYNEEQIEEGRRQRDIYPRLQEDIDRSRQMYEERVDPRVRDEVDYFHQEMINILAGGDAGALGM
jgi:hypothetical protein